MSRPFSIARAIVSDFESKTFGICSIPTAKSLIGTPACGLTSSPKLCRSTPA